LCQGHSLWGQQTKGYPTIQKATRWRYRWFVFDVRFTQKNPHHTKVRFLRTGGKYRGLNFVSFCALAMASLLFLVGSCLSQDKGGVDQTVALPEVQRILSSAQLSGSLEYWGLCDGSKPRSEFPRLRPVSGHEGSTRDVLQELF